MGIGDRGHGGLERAVPKIQVNEKITEVIFQGNLAFTGMIC